MPTDVVNFKNSQSHSNAEPIPLVVVEGFMGGIGQAVGGNFEYYLNGEGHIAKETRRKVIFAGYATSY